jgi:hypothetical protein
MAIETINGFRLSPQQRRLWSLMQEDGHVWGRTLCQVAVDGSLEAHRLRQALQAVVRRHEILRTSFGILPGMSAPLQVINEPGEVSYVTCDLQDLAPTGQGDEVNRVFDLEVAQDIDLARGDALQVVHLCLGPSRHILIIRLTALCGDERGLENLVAEIQQAYVWPAGEPRFDEEAIQYADVADTLNELEDMDTPDADGVYDELKEVSHTFDLALPYEIASASKTHFAPRVLRIGLAPELLERLSACCHQRQIPPDAFLASCWQALLHRLTGESRFVTGVTYLGRPHPILGGALGLFVKCVPIISEVSPPTRFINFVESVRSIADRTALSHESFSWDKVEIEPTGGSYSPLWFDYYVQRKLGRDSDPSFVIERLYSCTDRFKVRAAFREHPNSSLTFDLYYESGTITAEGGLRLAGQLIQLLESAISAPETPIWNLALMSPSERQHLLSQSRPRPGSQPFEQCLHNLFAVAAKETPDRAAVIHGDEQLTFRELNLRANQLAHFLRGLGLGVESRVALCLTRSLGMIIAVAGVLKAGCAYVPIDPGRAAPLYS